MSDIEEILDISTLYQDKILLDYLHCNNPLKEYFQSCHSEFHSVKYFGDRELLKEILFSYNKSINAHENVLENIERVTDENVYFVVTGQQPGFLSGPLYTIYKALSAIVYAERIVSDRDDLTVIPLFWNASEDHDVLEVNNIMIQNKNKEIVKIEIPERRIMGKSLERVLMSEMDVEKMILWLRDELPETEFSETIFEDILIKEVRQSKYWGEFFSRVMNRLLGKWGLVLVEPYLFRKHLTEFFEKLLTDPIKYNKVFLKTTNDLKELGYKPKMHKKENIVGLFYIDKNGYRHRIVVTQDNEYLLDDGTVFTKEEIVNLLYKSPESFSTNAIFRPIAQDIMLPTYLYVGGPSEIGYHIQIKDLYKEFRMTQPNLKLRMGATLVEKHIYKILNKYSIKVSELRDVESLIKRLLKNRHTQIIEPYFDQVKLTLDELEKHLAEINKELANRTRGKRKRIEKILSEIEDMFLEYLKNENQIMVSQLRKAHNYIFPLGKPQERVFNIIQYLNKYSLSVLDCIKSFFENYQEGTHVVIKCWMS